MKTKWLTYYPLNDTLKENWEEYITELWGDRVVGFFYAVTAEGPVVQAAIYMGDLDGTDATPETSD